MHMKKFVVGLTLASLLICPTVFCDTITIVQAKSTVSSQKIYENVKITGIEDMTLRNDRLYPRDMVENIYRNSYGKSLPKTSFTFKSLNGKQYVIHSYGSLKENQVGFFILESPRNSKKKQGDFVYMNQPRFAQWFRVYKMTTSEPGINLWAVVSDRGAATSSIISGFYVFMDKGGKLIPIVTDDDMAAFGMPFDSREQNPPGHAFAHMLKREIQNGKLYLEYAYQYWYGNMPHSSAQYVVEKTGYLSWDNAAQTFKLVP